jgi:prevent-host-death family protein
VNVAVKELKSRLSEYLRRVRAGERLTITDRGEPVAEIYPLGRHRKSGAQRLADLADAGEVTLPRGRGLRDIEPMPLRGRSIAGTLLEDRQ